MAVDENVQWINSVQRDDADLESDAMLEQPERAPLWLPSNLKEGEVARLGLEKIAGVEARLRIGQINDTLEALRIALGWKALSFRRDVRYAGSTRQTTIAYGKVRLYDEEARGHRSAYAHLRAALLRLGGNDEYTSGLHDITDEDMIMNKDVTEENRIHQNKEVLAWFWLRSAGKETNPLTEGEDRLRECKR